MDTTLETIYEGAVGQDLSYCLLSSVTVFRGNEQVPLGHARQRCVLAALMIDANRPLQVETLIYRVWGENPPGRARNVLRSYLSRLRTALGASSSLRHVDGGYVLAIEPDALDLNRFRRTVAEARVDGLPLDRRIELLRRALGLWSGPALAGLEGEWVEAVRTSLDRERCAAMVECHAGELRRGRHAEILGELSEHVGEQPTDEGSVRHLMTALYRSGRQAEALECYEKLRRMLAEELGIDPDPATRQLHGLLLRGELPSERRTDDSMATSAVPAQLPSDVAGFTGRTDDLHALDALLDRSDRVEQSTRGGRLRQAPTVIVISGAPGIGKTALAVHWAHRNRGAFPDGQLYVNLCGHQLNREPLSPSMVLGRFLRALGVEPDRIPVDADELSALYRTCLSGKQVLVVLDDAINSQQVEPLLPGDRGCRVLVTSRYRLGALVSRQGAKRLTLDALSTSDSRNLLLTLLGERRVNAEPADAERICALSGNLPLALRILAANLADRPFDTLAKMADNLDCGNRLNLIADSEEDQYSVRSAFDLSYQSLAPDTQRIFRALGAMPAPDFGLDLVAALTDTPVDEVAVHVERLTAAHLLEQFAGNRYRIHDLIRLYAAERAHTEDGDGSRAIAGRRLADYYLACIDATALVMPLQWLHTPGRGDRRVHQPPIFTTAGQALTWLEIECAGILAAIHHTAVHGPFEASWHLLDALRGFIRYRPRGEEWLAATKAATSAARRAGNLRAQAIVQLGVADAYHSLGKFEDAIMADTEALALCRSISWREGEGSALGGLGRAYYIIGRLRAAIESLQESVAIRSELGLAAAESSSQGSLGRAYHHLGTLQKARFCYQRSIDLLTEGRYPLGQALGYFYLGAVERDLGSPDTAVRHLHQALELSRAHRFRQCAAMSLSYMALVSAELGQSATAWHHLEAAQQELHDTGDRRVQAECLSTLAEALLRLGDPRGALDHSRLALATARSAYYRQGEIRALIDILASLVTLGENNAEQEMLRTQASPMISESGYQLLDERLRALGPAPHGGLT